MAGTYVRNPPGSRHSPRPGPGCVIFVKLRQMEPGETGRVVIDTSTADWRPGESEGHAQCLLHAPASGRERVTLERLAAGAALPARALPGGEEILVLSGELADASARHGPQAWIRNPPGRQPAYVSASGAVLWCKRGHIDPPS